LRNYIAAAVGSERADSVCADVVCDLPAHALLAASRGAEMLVVGARGLGRVPSVLIGSVSQQCLHHATVPIAIVGSRPKGANERERIVVGVDGSENAQRALSWAIREAGQRKAQLDVVTAWQMPYAWNLPLTITLPMPVEYERSAKDLLARAVADADTGAGPAPRLLALRGGPLPVLLDQSRHADLLVVGSRGLGIMKRAFLGSVATQLSWRAACPIVVVPDIGRSEPA
jgi:nucleotide-binding universal stress UspA family protein